MANLALKDSEPFGEGLRRVVDAQHRALDECLAGRGESIEKAVHNARTTCKKLRAIHRLVGGSLGRKNARRANAFYRDLARGLSEARDAHVMVRTLESLGGREQFPSLTDEFHAQEEKAERVESQLGSVMAKAREALARFEREHPFLVLPDEFATVEKGMVKVYGEGRSLFREAQDKPTPDIMHEWRKRAKDMLYITQLLRPLWPEEMRAHGREWKRLGDLLGEEHDLTVLLHAAKKAKGNREESRELKARLSARRDELRGQCWPLGRRLYAQPQRAWRNRMAALWKAWKSQSEELT